MAFGSFKESFDSFDIPNFNNNKNNDFSNYSRQKNKKNDDFINIVNNNADNKKKNYYKKDNNRKKKYNANPSTARNIKKLALSTSLLLVAFGGYKYNDIMRNDETKEFNQYMKNSVEKDPILLINNYSKVKSSNYMIYKMLSNSNPEDIDRYNELIVALPEFQEGLNKNNNDKNMDRYNKSIEIILKNKDFILQMIDKDLDNKLKQVLTNENKNNFDLKNVSDIDNINFNYNTYITGKDASRQDRIIATSKYDRSNSIDILSKNKSVALNNILKLRRRYIRKRTNSR